MAGSTSLWLRQRGGCRCRGFIDVASSHHRRGGTLVVVIVVSLSSSLSSSLTCRCRPRRGVLVEVGRRGGAPPPVVGRILWDGGQCVAELAGAGLLTWAQCPSLVMVVVRRGRRGVLLNVAWCSTWHVGGRCPR